MAIDETFIMYQLLNIMSHCLHRYGKQACYIGLLVCYNYLDVELVRVAYDLESTARSSIMAPSDKAYKTSY